MSHWFRNLRVSQKLMLISIFFVLPDSVMFFFFITGINGYIQFARLEQKGNEYQRPLETLLALIPEHRQLAQRGTEGAQLAATQEQIDRTFDFLEEVDSRIGVDLQFTDEGLAKRKRERYRVHTVRKEWQDLTAHSAEMEPAARSQRYLDLIAAVRMMITHAGDLSNLILDPDLDSYYVMDATLLALPQMQDRLAAVIAHGESVLRNPETISIQERQQLTVSATLLKEADLDRIKGSLETALTEDPNFYGESASLQARLPLALQQFHDSSEAFIELTTRVARSEKSPVTAAEYVACGNAARSASFNLWNVADGELDVLLQTRIDAFRHKRAMSLLVAACALFAAVGFVTFITKSISGPLHQQATALRSANTALHAEIAERKRAEEELRHSETQLAAAQKIARIGSWELDLETNELSWSDETYRIHGLDPREVKASQEFALQLVHPDDRTASAAKFQKALDDKSSFSFEQRIIRHDGQERVLHQHGDVVLDENGIVKTVFGTAQDITERKEAEEQLEKVHNELLEVSRQAGMAEVATGVLHNVGNVLNSVNVSTLLISDRLNKSRVSHLTAVSSLLKEHASDLPGFFSTNPKGQRLPGFIDTLSQRLNVEQCEVLGEVEDLAKNIAHIKEIVAVQQNYAKISGVVESLDAANLVEDALQMNSAAFDRHRVKVVREFTTVPPVWVDKHKVLQILINIIRNAKYAVSETSSPDKHVHVGIRMNGSGRVKITIRDNGVGIAAENLDRIFAHGFTTKKDGHGFGLHSAALAARELGGALTVHSDGPGHGSTFTLELPITRDLTS